MCLVDALRVDGLVGVVGTCRSMRFYYDRGSWTWRRGMVPSAAASSSVQSQYLVPIHQMEFGGVRGRHQGRVPDWGKNTKYVRTSTVAQ